MKDQRRKLLETFRCSTAPCHSLKKIRYLDWSCAVWPCVSSYCVWKWTIYYSLIQGNASLMSPHPEDVFWSEYTDYYVLRILRNSLQKDTESFIDSSSFILMFLFTVLTNQNGSAELYVLLCSVWTYVQRNQKTAKHTFSCFTLRISQWVE